MGKKTQDFVVVPGVFLCLLCFLWLFLDLPSIPLVKCKKIHTVVHAFVFLPEQLRCIATPKHGVGGLESIKVSPQERRRRTLQN